MDALLYVTAWTSLSLFALAEVGRDRTARAWPRVVSAAGLALMVVHILIAMGWRHEWVHASAIAATAAQTRGVYGLDWGGGVYVNYVFVVLWTLAVLGRWGAHSAWGAAAPRRAAAAGSATRVPARVARWVFLIIIANATIVFAGGWRRLLGVAIVAALAVAWFGPRRESRATGLPSGSRSSAGEAAGPGRPCSQGE